MLRDERPHFHIGENQNPLRLGVLSAKTDSNVVETIFKSIRFQTSFMDSNGTSISGTETRIKRLRSRLIASFL